MYRTLRSSICAGALGAARRRPERRGSTPLNERHSRQGRRGAARIVALALLACFAVVILLAELSVLAHLDHVHDHDGVGGKCITCAYVQNAAGMLKHLGAAACGVALSLAYLLAAMAAMQNAASLLRSQTLVRLKARMNN